MESVAVMLDGLAAKLGKYNTQFRKSDQLVRQVLVCPVLREMGWDVEDPELVGTGYDFGGRSADYALLRNKKPIAAVRTRHLGGKLDGILDELTGYGVRYCIATDGKKWRVRDTAGPESGDVEFSVVGNPVSVCPQLMVLWRRNMYLPLKKAKSAKPKNAKLKETKQDAAKPPKPSAPGRYMPLSDLQPKQVASELVCPDKTARSIKTHKSLMVEVARWLAENKHLTPKACPIILSEKRYLLAKSPVHPTKKKFISPKPVGNMYLETNFNSQRILKNIGILLSQTDLDAANFSVKSS